VHGICAGGGLHFVADADITIVAAGAEFCDPHVSVGQVSAYETIALIRKSPMEAVLRMALTGRYERTSAARAYQLGIVSQIVEPAEQLRDTAQQLAEQIARNSPTAMMLTKRALWRALELGLRDACRAGGQDLVEMWGHPDQVEGPAAFTERREPEWQPLA
jgi:enoyl-CoA hydratase/carnithine racemase